MRLYNVKVLMVHRHAPLHGRCPCFPKTISFQRECISIHIGQAGCQIGNACWELYCLEHGKNRMLVKPVFIFSVNVSQSTLVRLAARLAMPAGNYSVLNMVRIGSQNVLFCVSQNYKKISLNISSSLCKKLIFYLQYFL